MDVLVKVAVPSGVLLERSSVEEETTVLSVGTEDEMLAVWEMEVGTTDEPDPVMLIDEISVELGGGVKVAKQEQTEDKLLGALLHMETKPGMPVVAV